MVICIPDVINEKWNKFASNVLTWNAAAIPTVSVKNGIWWGKWVSAYEHDRCSSSEPRSLGTDYVQSSKPMHFLKPALSTQYVTYDEFRILIWFGIINPGSLWAIPTSCIFWGKLEYGPYVTIHIKEQYSKSNMHGMWREFAGKMFCQINN